MIADVWFYVAAVPAVLLAAVSKGGLGGGGLVVLSVPLLSLIVPPPQAAAIMLPLLVAMDFTGLWMYRRDWSREHMRIIVPAAIVGIALGAAFFRVMNADAVRLLIGALALAFALNWWLKRKQPPPAATGPSIAKGGFWGAVSGFTSFVSHAGGPPLFVYLLPLRLDKQLFAGTCVVYFTAVNLVKLVPYAWLGQFHAENLLTSLVLLPLVPLGVRLGWWLQRKVDDKLFYNICYAALVVTGGKLAYDGVKGLI